MAKNEQITYLVANYNNGWAFSDLLESLENQTSSEWRCLICDDSSTDNSSGTIEQLLNKSPLKPQFRFIKNLKNLGYIDTLKRLLDEAQTDIVAVLDADDALEKEATKELLLAYLRVPKAGLVCSRYTFVNTDFSASFDIYGASIPPGETLLTGGDFGHIRSFRRSLYFQCPGFDSSILYAEDRDILYKLEEWTKPLFIDKPLYRYRYVPGSQSMDPAKREIGYSNHFRAWRNALTRRKVSGVRWYIASALYWLRQPEPPKKRLEWLIPPLHWLQEKLRILKFDEMNRSDRWHR